MSVGRPTGDISSRSEVRIPDSQDRHHPRRQKLPAGQVLGDYRGGQTELQIERNQIQS